MEMVQQGMPGVGELCRQRHGAEQVAEWPVGRELGGGLVPGSLRTGAPGKDLGVAPQDGGNSRVS